MPPHRTPAPRRNPAPLQQPGTDTTHYAATFGDVTDTGLRWLRSAQCAHAAARGLNTQIHAVGDGAPGIADQAQIPFGAQGGYVVDRFHVCDSFTAAAPDPAHAKDDVSPLRERQKPSTLRRSKHAHAKDDVTPLREALRANDSAQVLAALRPRTERPKISDPQAPVCAALRYLENRSAQLDYAYAYDYAHAHAPDLPVGSGLIKSGHKNVLPAPLKKSGGWRVESHAHARCQFRTLRAHHLWNTYWSNT